MNRAHIEVHAPAHSRYVELTVKGASTKNKGLALLKLRVDGRALSDALGRSPLLVPHPAEEIVDAELIR